MITVILKVGLIIEMLGIKAVIRQRCSILMLRIITLRLSIWKGFPCIDVVLGLFQWPFNYTRRQDIVVFLIGNIMLISDIKTNLNIELLQKFILNFVISAVMLTHIVIETKAFLNAKLIENVTTCNFWNKQTVSPWNTQTEELTFKRIRVCALWDIFVRALLY